MNKKECGIIALLTVLITFMDITGLPTSLFGELYVADIEPMYLTLMMNFVFIGVVAALVLRLFCPNWKLGLKREGLLSGVRAYGGVCLVVGLLSGVAFYIGLRPLDLRPSVGKVFVEGILYYFGVAAVEELYVRGLLLNWLERLFDKRQNKTAIAIVLSSVLFGVGHIFGVLGQPPLVMICKVVWTVALGFFLGMVYKKTTNLWAAILFHFFIDICAIPYCFSSTVGYAELTLYLLLPIYSALGVYSLFALRRN